MAVARIARDYDAWPFDSGAHAKQSKVPGMSERDEGRSGLWSGRIRRASGGTFIRLAAVSTPALASAYLGGTRKARGTARPASPGVAAGM